MRSPPRVHFSSGAWSRAGRDAIGRRSATPRLPTLDRLDWRAMMDRLKPMISLLLALLVCCATSQAKVCELSCGLDAQGAACRMAAASRPSTMQEMPHGHCSPASRTAPNAAFSGLHPSTCGHAFSPAVEDAVAAKARFASSQAALVQSSSNGLAVPHVTSLSPTHPPPLLFAANPLVVALRI